MTTPSNGCSLCLRRRTARRRWPATWRKSGSSADGSGSGCTSLGVTFALWRSAATDAPLRVLALTIAAMRALDRAARLGGAVAACLFPQMLDAWSVVWWRLERCPTGVALVAAVARRRGMAASATLAVGGVAVVHPRLLFVVPAVVSAQQAEWKDPSPHTTSARHRRRRACSWRCWTGVAPARRSFSWRGSERRRTTTMTLPRR